MVQFQIFFSDEFKQRLRTLAKRYRQIRSDLQPLLNDLQAGNLIGFLCGIRHRTQTAT